jgi:hypothetical protein
MLFLAGITDYELHKYYQAHLTNVELVLTNHKSLGGVWVMRNSSWERDWETKGKQTV